MRAELRRVIHLSEHLKRSRSSPDILKATSPVGWSLNRAIKASNVLILWPIRITSEIRKNVLATFATSGSWAIHGFLCSTCCIASESGVLLLFFSFVQYSASVVRFLSFPRGVVYCFCGFIAASAVLLRVSIRLRIQWDSRGVRCWIVKTDLLLHVVYDTRPLWRSERVISYVLVPIYS